MRVEPILAFCDRLDSVRIGMEEGLDDWPIASQIWEYKEAVSIIKKLIDENNNLSKDADRYRWIRNTQRVGSIICPDSPVAQMWVDLEMLAEDRLDKVIDEAMVGVKK